MPDPLTLLIYARRVQIVVAVSTKSHVVKKKRSLYRPNNRLMSFGDDHRRKAMVQESVSVDYLVRVRVSRLDRIFDISKNGYCLNN